MNQAVIPGDYGHFALPKDSSGVTQWIRQHAEVHGYALDQAQQKTLLHFQRLYEDLIALERLESSLIRLLAKRKVVKGIYLWGGVGRGKSFLMDSFYNCAPARNKKRTHFHRFMQEIHHELKSLQGQSDPVTVVAKRIAKQARLLCLDEMHVTDIGDAMLMRRLLEGLFSEGVVLVTTSNQIPDDLYANGLQRSQFIPAIELLKQNLEVLNVDAGADYRLRALEKVEIYHSPLDEAAERNLDNAFNAIARHEGESDLQLDIEGRIVVAKRHARGIAWFEFQELCGGPRGQADYIELARRYHTVLISNMPRLTENDADKARRLVWLVDEFYDRRVKLIVSAEAPADQLFSGGKGSGEFARTVSRLTEMQSRQYLGQAHLA